MRQIFPCQLLLLLIFFLSKNSFSQIYDCESIKQMTLQLLQSASETIENQPSCIDECKYTHSYFEELRKILQSGVDCSLSSEATVAVEAILKAHEKNKITYEKCMNCLEKTKILGSTKANKSGNPGNNPMLSKSPTNPLPTTSYRSPIYDPVEQLDRLANTMSVAQGELMAHDREKQNRMNELNARNLSNLIELQPNIPEEQYDEDKKSIENNLYGDADTDKFRNCLGSPDAKSLDELLDTGSESVIASGGSILTSTEEYTLSWSFRFIKTQVKQVFGKGEVKFNIYEVTGLLTNNTSKKITFNGPCCNEVRHFQYSQYSSQPAFGKLNMRLEPHENNKAVYSITVPAGEGVTDPTFSLGPIEIEKDATADIGYTPSLTTGQSILYSDTVMEIGWDYRYIKTLTCGVPLNPEAKFHQYQINAYLINKVRKMICFTICCTDIGHSHGQSGCGNTGGNAKFPMRIGPKTTVKETYFILVPVNQNLPDPGFSGVASYILQ